MKRLEGPKKVSKFSKPGRTVRIFAESPQYVEDDTRRRQLEDMEAQFMDTHNKAQKADKLQSIIGPLTMQDEELASKADSLMQASDSQKNEVFNAWEMYHQLPKTGRDSTFIKEAEDLRTFFNRTEPDTNVDIVPFYGNDDFTKVAKGFEHLNKGDLPVFMGHSGSRIGGISNDRLADLYRDCSAEELAIGSCSFNRYSAPFRSTGKTTYMRPNTPWLGVNPNGKTLNDAFYGTRYKEGHSDPEYSKAEYGKDFVKFRGNKLLPKAKGGRLSKFSLNNY